MSTDLDPFDPTQPYELPGSVSLRPEPFGALIYDYATRQLSFLKTPLLVTVVRELGKQPDARRTLTAAAIPTTEHDRYLAALASLYQSGTIVRRAASEREQEHHEAG